MAADDRPQLSLRTFYVIVSASVVVGLASATAVAATAGHWADGLRWGLYMLAVASVAVILGLVFGVPRARVEYSPEATERYRPNSNLEDISDWLTKLLVGAGLVQLAALPSGLRSAGAFLGADLRVGNPEAFAVSAVLYGAGLGFGAGYLWTRLRLRYLLETTDRESAEVSRKREAVMRSLREAAGTTPDGVVEPDRVLREVAEAAVTATGTSTALPVLWVDDNPGNNASIADALRSLGIRVDLALSTREALTMVAATGYGLIISDLSRHEEDGHKPEAGLELLAALRDRGSTVPVVIYAGSNAMRRKQQILDAGAMMVTTRPSEVFQAAVDVVTYRR